MPDMDGLRVARAIQRIRTVPICLLTGHYISADESRLVTRVFRKPIEDTSRFFAEILSLLPAKSSSAG